MNNYATIRQAHTEKSIFDNTFRVLEQNNLLAHGKSKSIQQYSIPAGIGEKRDLFPDIAYFLKMRLNENSCLTVLVDEVNPFEINPLRSSGWSSLLAMLILAFPEIRWVFMVVTGKPSPEYEKVEINKDKKETKKSIDIRAEWDKFQNRHGAGSLTEPRSTPLFDGYGIRLWIKERMKKDTQENNAYNEEHMPKRPKLALVLDDEVCYSRYLGLIAYTNGYRVHATESWTETKNLLKDEGLIDNSEGFELSIEDWYLNFHDQTEHQISDLDKRLEILPALRQEDKKIRRRFLTVGDRRNGEGHNKRFIRRRQLRKLRLKERNQGMSVRRGEQKILKPASGIYALWEQLGLARVLTERVGNHKYRGLATGYHWPPIPEKKTPKNNNNNVHSSHSSPGRLKQIAEHLVSRATQLQENSNSVTDDIRGAVLATQALEILGCRTPTLSLEALGLKHVLETKASCRFPGVTYHVALGNRMTDMQRNLKAMGRWLDHRRREDFILNAEAPILSRMVDILDKFGRFEEAEQCRVRLRTLHQKMQTSSDIRDHKIGSLLMWPLRAYAELVLRSLGHFAVAVALMLIAFSFLFWGAGICDNIPFNNGWYGLFEGIHATIAATFTGELSDPHETNNACAIISWLATITGFINLGLLISHFYTIFTRK